ncbi:MAG: hypothetical protein KC877_02275 [Candidatus Kaiserbacteria bacterium]|nr:hypothetical protein [Candidatus Kaiserbacteria bacterium]MCB9816849.1 hypothetical protein [Candidatus Nomurabacteria bacterium]
MKDTDIVIVSMGAIDGAGTTVDERIEMLKVGGPEFITVGKADKYMPIDFSTRDTSLSTALVAPVPLTDGELAELAGLTRKEAKRYDRHQLFGLIAAKEAMAPLEGIDVSRFACTTATGGAGLNTVAEAEAVLAAGKPLRKIHYNLGYLPNILQGYLIEKYGFTGPVGVKGDACAASAIAIIDMIRIIRAGDAEAGLVVGAEAGISDFGIGSFQVQGVLGKGLPFHTDRDGFVMGEGAAAIVMMTYAKARKLGLKPIVKIAGYGDCGGGTTGGSITSPNAEAAAMVMGLALAKARVPLEDVDWIKVHGTGTGAGDIAETNAVVRLALQEMFKDIARFPELGMYLKEGLTWEEVESDPEYALIADAVSVIAAEIKVMSMKSYIGHLLGAAAIAELVAVISFVQAGLIPPTRGLEADGSLDPECDVVNHVRTTIVQDSIWVLLNSFGFGGVYASLLLEFLDLEDE